MVHGFQLPRTPQFKCLIPALQLQLYHHNLQLEYTVHKIMNRLTLSYLLDWIFIMYVHQPTTEDTKTNTMQHHRSNRLHLVQPNPRPPPILPHRPQHLIPASRSRKSPAQYRRDTIPTRPSYHHRARSPTPHPRKNNRQGRPALCHLEI